MNNRLVRAKLTENIVWKLTVYVIVSNCCALKFFVFSYSYSQEYLIYGCFE